VLQRGDLGPQLAPRLRGALADGRLSLTELRGVPIVLNFWASWCVPCRQEAPLLQRTWGAQARPRGVLFLGLDMQDLTDDARSFLREFHIDYLNIRDPSNTVARRYGLTGIPETYFISPRGRVVGHVIGVSSPAQLRAGIAAAVTGTPTSRRKGGAQRSTR
jgi:cytochrome c biogenesis protein CcmG/thiol:disulfide interchange protein DsbE